MPSNQNSTYTSSLNGKRKSTTDAKDPSRPRRKKARRACSACQKSHQTCGNERPCGSCVKRGMAESCRDGIRKKPKYLEEGSYRVFTIQYGLPYTNLQFAQPIELPPSRDIEVQSSLPNTPPGQGLYACPDLSPWSICAEDPFIGQDLNCEQSEMGDTCYMDSPQSDVSEEADKPDSLLAFAIGSGWSSTFLQSEYRGGPV